MPSGDGVLEENIVEVWVDIGHEQGEVEVMECVEEVGVPREVLHLEDCVSAELDAITVCVEGHHEGHERVFVVLFDEGEAIPEGCLAVFVGRVEYAVDIGF